MFEHRFDVISTNFGAYFDFVYFGKVSSITTLYNIILLNRAIREFLDFQFLGEYCIVVNGGAAHLHNSGNYKNY